MSERGSAPAQIVRFSHFELDLRSGDLSTNGRRRTLAEQPLQILKVLLERPGELVTRDELRQRLWPADTFVDFEHGLNAAVKRLRDALGDSADVPRLIETIPRRGYRFIAPVSSPDDRRFQHIVDGKVALQEMKEESESGATASLVIRRRRLQLIAVLTGALLLLAMSPWWWLRVRRERLDDSRTAAPAPANDAGQPLAPMLAPPARSIYTPPLVERRKIQDASNRDTYTLDLSGCLGKDAVYLRFEDAFPTDGWGPAVHDIRVDADGEVIARFVPGTNAEDQFLIDADHSQVDRNGVHRFMDEERYAVYRFVPPSGTRRLTAAIDMWDEFKVTCTSVRSPSGRTTRPRR